MTILEFKALRLGDKVINTKGEVSVVFDIDRNKRVVKTSRFGGAWRDYHEVKLAGAGRKTGESYQ